MRKLYLLCLLILLASCSQTNQPDLSMLAKQSAENALYPEDKNLVSHPLRSGVEVLSAKVSPEQTQIVLSSANETAYEEATDRIIIALAELLTGKVARLEFAITAEKPDSGLEAQAFPCSGATRITYPNPRALPTKLADTNIMLNPGHGLTQLDSGSWGYQRPVINPSGTPPVYAHEDLTNLELAIITNQVLSAAGASVDSVRNLDKNAGTGLSGQAKWQEGSRHYLQSLGVPEHVWNSEGNALDGSCNMGKDIRVRPFYANYKGVDILVSLHSNANNSTSARGTWVIYNNGDFEYGVPSSTYTQSVELARSLASSVVASIRQERPDLNWPEPVIKADDRYGETGYAKMPSVILEVGFHTNAIDGQALNEASFRQAVAEGIENGLKVFLGDTPLPPSEPSTPDPLSITMSSDGRVLLSWPESTTADYYSFAATFNGETITVMGQAQAKDNAFGSAVATFTLQPDAPEKAGKEICFQVRAHNATGVSNFGSLYCTSYQYYTGNGIQVGDNLVGSQLKLIQ